MTIYNYKTYFATLFLLCTAFFVNGQQAERILVKSFNLEGNQVVLLDLAGNVEVQPWNNDILRIQMTISLETGSDAMLKSLIQAGRYNLKSQTGDDAYTISNPEMDKQIMVRGKELVEELTYIVYAPENVLVKLKDNSTSGLVGENSSL